MTEIQNYQHCLKNYNQLILQNNQNSKAISPNIENYLIKTCEPLHDDYDQNSFFNPEKTTLIIFESFLLLNNHLIQVEAFILFLLVSNFTTTTNKLRLKSKSNFRQFLEQYFGLVLIFLLDQTLFAGRLSVFIIFFAIACFLVYYLKNQIPNRKVTNQSEAEQLKNSKSQPEPILAITIIKSMCMILSIIAILAVDFPSIYPPRFKKSLNYGYSIMDTGVGIIMFGSGLAFGTSKRIKTNKNDIFQVVITAILGGFRFLTVRAVNYHEKVDEYGVHWNFFLTIAVCKVLAEIFLRGSNCKYRQEIKKEKSKFLSSWIFNPSIFLPILLPVLYQILILDSKFFFKTHTIQEVILTYDRSFTSKNYLINLFYANREGLFSTFGYFSIFAFGNALSLNFYNNSKNKTNEKSDEICKTCLKMTFFGSFVLLPGCIYFFGHGSRRMANLSYVVWMNCLNCSFLYGFGGLMIVYFLHF